jgi:hypothetical protein
MIGLPIRILGLRTIYLPFRTRFPFSYGIGRLSETLHAVLRLEVEINGHSVAGYAAENLAPRWFTKNPDLSLEQEQAELKAVINQAGAVLLDNKQPADLFGHWRRLYDGMGSLGKALGRPPLLTNWGVSLLERCLWDALARVTDATVSGILVNDALTGLDLGKIRPSLGALSLQRLLPAQPVDRVKVRHCIGLEDPLEAGEGEAARPADGLPYNLQEVIATHGLSHFKIKLCGDFKRDSERLSRILPMLPTDRAFSIDANETFPTLATFREQWEAHVGSSYGEGLQMGLLWVEQPLHREASFLPETALGIDQWDGAPPLIIDEADAELPSLPTALQCGYRGTSHKNCKGIIKTLANVGTLRRWSIETGKTPLLSAEDLTNLPPIALLQDCAVLASLGVTHAERNGHHYVHGMDWAGKALAEDAAEVFHGLFDAKGLVRLHQGSLDLSEINAANGLGLGKMAAVVEKHWF